MKSLPIARAKRSTAILVCRKCLKRVRKGKNLPRALKSEMRAALPEGSKTKPRIVMTSCFGICPKRAVVVTDGAHLARGEYLLVGGGSVKAAAQRLGEADASGLPQSELRAAE